MPTVSVASNVAHSEWEASKAYLEYNLVGWKVPKLVVSPQVCQVHHRVGNFRHDDDSHNNCFGAVGGVSQGVRVHQHNGCIRHQGLCNGVREATEEGQEQNGLLVVEATPACAQAPSAG
jgi:hypothetical protein